jgi:uncharacterized FAD-dependent dehydrogenase
MHFLIHTKHTHTHSHTNRDETHMYTFCMYVLGYVRVAEKNKYKPLFYNFKSKFFVSFHSHMPMEQTVPL